MNLLALMFTLTLAFLAGGFGVFLATSTHLPPAVYRARAWFRRNMSWLMPRTARLFILDEDGVPTPAHSEEEWAAWFATNHEKRNVASYSTSYDDQDVPGMKHRLIISTVFLGVDHNFQGYGPPLIYETIVEGGLLDGEKIRHASAAEAIEVHEQIMMTQLSLLKTERLCSAAGAAARNNGIIDLQ